MIACPTCVYEIVICEYWWVLMLIAIVYYVRDNYLLDQEDENPHETVWRKGEGCWGIMYVSLFTFCIGAVLVSMTVLYVAATMCAYVTIVRIGAEREYCARRNV